MEIKFMIDKNSLYHREYDNSLSKVVSQGKSDSHNLSMVAKVIHNILKYKKRKG